MWREAATARQKARWLRDDADRLQKFADDCEALAAAIADGREDEYVQLAGPFSR